MVSQNSINDTVEDNDFSVNRSTAGTPVISSTNHTDNTDGGSSAGQVISVGGASGGDPFINLNVSSTQNFTMGIDNSDSDNLKITNGTNPSIGTNFWKMSPAGARNLPQQPAFKAQGLGNPNVTGAGTTYVVKFDQVTLFDQTSSFDGVSTFTAPIAGLYCFIANVELDNLTVANTQGYVRLTTPLKGTRIWIGNPGSIKNVNNRMTAEISVLYSLNLGETVVVDVTVGGGAGDTVGTGSVGNTLFFCGWMVA